MKFSHPNWLKILLLLLISEKILQHTLVTLGFVFNWQSMRESVAVNPTILMVVGAVEVVLFALCFWGLVRGLNWVPGVLVGLSCLDIIGEMVAQGRVIIAINVSFVVAMILLILTLIYRRQIFHARPLDGQQKV